jgi:ribose 5-phosphate isomerase RpiB
MAVDILRMWIETAFAGGRHERRLDKIAQIERGGAGIRSGVPRG